MMATPLAPMPAHLIFTGTEQPLRRKRTAHTEHRTWEILPRYGTAETDRWTVVATPRPADGNPAADIENGQFATLQEARDARRHCIQIDDGTTEEEQS
jgi:hypothetical protein